MIYPNEKGVAIMGQKGFIGSRLVGRDLPAGVYFFNSPSSNVLFDENLDYCVEETINDFLKVLQYCRDNKTYLVYPSSATIYNKNTSYARCKSIIEELAQIYAIPSLGLRISAGYGPSEKHKGKYASVIYQWCKQIKRGERPVIFGDGTQTRDFIYEDDIADNIENLARAHVTGVIDLGTGVNVSFNEVVAIINKVLRTNIEPLYVPKPAKYVQETKVKSSPHKIALEEGIRKILNTV